MTISKDTFFKADKVGTVSKGEITTSASRAITDEEAASRDRKTARLRQLRLARPAAEAEKGKAKRKG